MMSPDHIAHPYPTEKEKLEIMSATGIELKQLTNWFVNNRKRFWKPRVEARLQQQRQAQKVASMANSSQSIAGPTNSDYNSQQPIMIFNNRMNMISSSQELKVHHFKEPIPTHQHSFQIITNQQPFAVPCQVGEVESSNSQVVSMGSLSYSSDSDSASISHISHDDEEQVIFTNVNTLAQSPKSRRIPLRKRRVILDSATPAKSQEKVHESKRNVVSPQNGVARSQIPTLKRIHSERDLPSFSKTWKHVLIRPRAITFDGRIATANNSASKRKCVEDWQSACQNARHGYDATLPSLEEAANLFGYSGK